MSPPLVVKHRNTVLLAGMKPDGTVAAILLDAGGHLLTAGGGDSGGGGGSSDTELPNDVISYVGRAEINGVISASPVKFLGGLASNTQGSVLWLDVFGSADASGEPVLHCAVPSGAPIEIPCPPGAGLGAAALSYSWSTDEQATVAPGSPAGLSVTFYLNA